MIITLQSLSQSDSTEKKWTVSTILFSNNFHNTFLTDRPNFLNGVFVKRKFKNYKLRLGIEHSSQNVKLTLTDSNKYLVNGYYREKSLLFGFQKPFTDYYRFVPYYAVDLIGMDIKSEYEYKNDSIHKVADLKGFGVGVIPAIGFEYRITEAFSISLEARFQLIYFYTRNRISNLNISEPEFTVVNEVFDPNLKVFGNVTMNIYF